ncbi:hypothetical protein ELI_00735 [Erythrobacter litoralis HTCC2594]|uniref:Uncharacterized protein n=1 Tax=Erythrobacter litoralis (strain HTCC2594) TaxID=314225 RepID=Q2NDK2_ERYLH|nr:hypothetical protein ELI_00735 [Erythrobacter litoralis HTCC2594]
MKGGTDVLLDIDRGFFGFEEEFPSSPDTESIVGGLSVSTDLYGIFVHNILVGFGVALLVIY